MIIYHTALSETLRQWVYLFSLAITFKKTIFLSVGTTLDVCIFTWKKKTFGCHLYSYKVFRNDWFSLQTYYWITATWWKWFVWLYLFTELRNKLINETCLLISTCDMAQNKMICMHEFVHKPKLPSECIAGAQSAKNSLSVTGLQMLG